MPSGELQLGLEQLHPWSCPCKQCQGECDVAGNKPVQGVRWFHFSLDKSTGEQLLENFRKQLGTA